MASLRFMLVSLGIVASFYSWPVDGLHIEVSPGPVFNSASEMGSISCQLDSNNSDVKEILVINLVKNWTEIVASLNGVTETTSNNKHILAKGNIALNLTESYLTVTLKRPSKQDAGVYTCMLHYIAADNEISEERAVQSITWEDGTVDSLESMVKSLLYKVSHLEKELKERTKDKKESDASRCSYGSTHARLSSLERYVKTNITAALDTLTSLERSFHDETRAVAFSASINTTLQTDSSQTGTMIVFDSGLVNVGGGYDASTGVFTAPKDGNYAFNLVINFGIEQSKPDCRGTIVLKQNETPIADLALSSMARKDGSSANHSSRSSSFSTIYALHAGDQVKVFYSIKSCDVPFEITDKSIFSGFYVGGL